VAKATINIILALKAGMAYVAHGVAYQRISVMLAYISDDGLSASQASATLAWRGEKNGGAAASLSKA